MRVKLDSILAAVDFSDASSRVLPYAVLMAERFSAKLYVCHALDFAYAGIYDASLLVLPARARELAHEVEAKLKNLLAGTRVKWEPLIVEGDPANAIAQAADDKNVDLVIAATHGRSGLGRVLLGSVSERLLRTVRRPLLTVRQDTNAPKEGLRLKKILVGCDFSPDSAHALEHALNLAQEFQSEIHLVHAIEPTLYKHIDATTGALAADLELAVEKTIRQRLDALVPPEVRTWCEVKTACVSGYSFEEIVRYVTDHAIDLVVLGRRGHALLDRMLVGSTTDRVLRKAPCPVLAVERV